MSFFNMSMDGLPPLEARLRKFRFQIKSIIGQEMLRLAKDFLIPKIQEKIIDQDYIFKADLGEKPNLLDSLVADLKITGRELRVQISSTTNYAKFFEQGRPAGEFPSGKAYEYENIVKWLVYKHGVPDDAARRIAAVMIVRLEESSDVYRNPDPVIAPTAEEYEEEYTQLITQAIVSRVATL